MSDFKINSVQGDNNILGDGNTISSNNTPSGLLSPAKIIAQKDAILKNFTKSNWIELGVYTDSSDLIEDHSRLLRSLDFGDDDYEGNIISVLRSIIKKKADNATIIDDYLVKKFPDNMNEGEFISTSHSSTPQRKITFSPTAFTIPTNPQNPNLVSVMMPFSNGDGIYKAIGNVCSKLNAECKRADEIWNDPTIIQDIFELIFTSKVVICDFSGKNPNVFYEAGIAHTLGKTVIPIVQHLDDIPFDIRHYRVLKYIPNTQGYSEFENELEKRLTTLGLNSFSDLF
jgi:hypothetical protein